jgi:uncharacterized protein (DUF924 family)
MDTIINKILVFWFGYIDQKTQVNAISKKWFRKDPEFDLDIKIKFEEDLKNAANGTYDECLMIGKGSLALIVLFDQFSRNIYRNTAKSFAYDEKALKVCLDSIEKESDQRLMFIHRVFLYMPLMHSEEIEMQRKALECFKKIEEEASISKDINVSYYKNTYGFSKKHFDIIEMFGRFPHRNVILGRESTEEEKGFLKLTGSSF